VILCVCPSPAVDLTYRVDDFLAGATNRIVEVSERPGGKAVNVARVLHRTGTHATVLAPLGGATGAQLRQDLEAMGISVDVAPTNIATRRTVTVVDEHTGEATVLSEPAVIDCWPELVTLCRELAGSADAVVISGSLPLGAPVDGLAELVRIFDPSTRPVVVDSSGPALAAAVEARPTCIKPNHDELVALTGSSDTVAAASELARTHGTVVVASRGPDGAVAVDDRGAWQARPRQHIAGNPTGAGDALVAGLARGLVAGEDLADILADAVALSAAAVLHPVAGDVDLSDVDAQRGGVTVAELDLGGAR
jgi:tagatose 6-phosphate kinase